MKIAKQIAVRASTISLLVLVALVLGLVGCSNEQPQPAVDVVHPKVLWGPHSFIVDPGFWTSPPPSQIVKVQVSENESKIEVKFSVSGGWNNDVNFLMTDPTGKIFFDKVKIYKEFDKSFPITVVGTYQLIFENSFSPWSSKTITATVISYPK